MDDMAVIADIALIARDRETGPGELRLCCGRTTSDVELRQLLVSAPFGQKQ